MNSPAARRQENFSYSEILMRKYRIESFLRANANRGLGQALVENAKDRRVRQSALPIRRTPKRRLRHVDFVFDGNEIRGLEQNPDAKSRWAQMANGTVWQESKAVPERGLLCGECC
jgi:hypothetical protein